MPAGRPVKITDEVIAKMFEEMTEGKTLKQVVDKHGYNYAHISLKISKSKELTDLHARARQEFAHVCVEKMFQIADEEEDVQRARLKCDNVKWYAARVLPKQYGDKLTHAGDPDQPVVINSNIPFTFTEPKK